VFVIEPVYKDDLSDIDAKARAHGPTGSCIMDLGACRRADDIQQRIEAS